MSYCHWSDPDSDLYCYQGEGGWITHVAKLRVRPGNVEGQKRVINQMPLVPIGLPHDGETFCDADLEDFLATLTRLHALGYWVPASVFDQVREELAEQK